ncbi:MAG: alkaline phosphatase family protein [Microthrixaceae bacterium]
MELDLVSSDLAMVHLDENDGVSHVHGPQSEDAIRQAGLADEVLAELLGPYRRVWSDTLVLVVSDHCQEAVVRPVGAAPAERRVADAMAQLARRTVDAGGPALRWYVDGTCAVVAVAGDEPGRSEPAAIVALRRELERIAWVEDVSEVAEGVFCVSGGPGELLGIDWGQLGDHGSTRCLEQVAVLGGGHAAVGELARRFSGRAVANATWAPVTLELLGG